MNPKIAELIRQYKQDQDNEVITTLWEDFRPLVINLMRKFSIPWDLQEDVSQDCFLHLLECANTFDPSLSVPFEGYYKTHLQYWFFNRIRKKTEALVVDQGWDMGASLSDLIESTMGNAHELTEALESQAELGKALESLTPKQRQAIVLFYLHEASLSEVAKQMGCSYRVAYKHKAAGLHKLRKAFE